jgi:hypothetical protein
LEFLGSEARVVRLNDRNLVEEPVGPGLIGDVFGAAVKSTARVTWVRFV